MLKIENLYKKYKGEKKYAVENFSLEVKSGEIFGFLGSNGAGKSTIIKCITGILPITSGKISVCDFDISTQAEEAKSCIGYVSDDHCLYENLTGKEYVHFIGNVFGVPNKTIEEKMNEYAKTFNMTHVLDSQIRTYSFGLKQKISIISALVHEPKFWVLDEPITGLDPQSAYEIKECMKMWKKMGNTVFFSSHNIEIVEKLCDRVAIISGGKLMKVIDMKNFKETSPVNLEFTFLKTVGAEVGKYVSTDIINKQAKKEVKGVENNKFDKNVLKEIYTKKQKIKYDEIDKLARKKKKTK